MESIQLVMDWAQQGTNPLLIALSLKFVADLADIVLPNDHWFLKATVWLRARIGQSRPDAPQEKFGRFVSGLLR